MFKRPLAAVAVVLCGSLLLPSLAPHASAQEDAGPAALLAAGITQYEAGELAAAKETLDQIDAIALSKEERQRLYAVLTDIETRLAQEADAAPEAPGEPLVLESPEPADETPPASAAAVLAQADAAVNDDPGTAIALYTSLIERGGEESVTAKARLADLLRNMNQDLTQAKRTLDAAEADLALGDLDAAELKFSAVAASGVELGWFDEQRVSRGVARIGEARAAAGETVAAADPAPAPEPEPAPAADDPTPPVVRADPPPPPPAAGNDLMAEARRAMALQFLRDAQDAEAQGFDALAVTLLTQAEELDPDNPAIAEAVAAANNEAAGRSVLAEEIDRFQIQREAIRDAYLAAINDAEANRAAGDLAAARTDAERAKARLEAGEDFFTPAEFERMRDRATELSIDIDRQRVEQAAREQEELLELQEKEELEQLRTVARESQVRVRELIKEARELQKEMKYDEALLLLDQALFIDENDFTAQLLRDVITDARIAVNYEKLIRERRELISNNRLRNIEATMPYDDIISYPEDWPELSRIRLLGLDDTGGESEANRETLQRLQKTIPIRFDANPLESVIQYIRETTGANIVVRWPNLIDAAGIERDLPISLQLNNVPAEQALAEVIQQANGAGFGSEIAYQIDNGIVVISTLDELRQDTFIDVYDIRDLLVQVPNFTDAPEFDLQDALSNTNSGGGGGGGGGGTGGGLFGDSDDDDDEEEITREELIEQIILLIQESVGTIDEWDNAESTVTELNSNLIIKTSATNHRQVNSLLSQLRETRAIQISVEARFLLVERNFLDELLVDFDVAWQGDGEPIDPDNPRTNPFDPDGGQVGDGFQPVVASGNTATLAGAVIESASFGPFFTSGPGLGFGVSFIDDLSVNFLVEATLANRNSISLTAPRITFFNGQRAYVVVARQISFISDLEPVPDSAGFDITISVTQAGVILDVEGTISADRRYVTLTLRPSLADVIDIEDFPIGQALVIDNDDGPPTIIESSLAVQLPILDITSVRTTVSVPDRGTLLVGGQRLVGEAEIEAGVPVLSKLPIINRLFTNTTKVEDERTLLILIKPTIIIQNEREEEAFPGITDRLQELGGVFN